MTSPDIVNRLAQHKTLGAAPRAELEWLARHGYVFELEAGRRLSTAGEPVLGLFALLSGRVVLYVDHGSGPQREMEWHTGDVTGLLPYSRMTKAPGTSVAEEPTAAFALLAEHFPALIRECHDVTSILVHSMVDRARAFRSKDLHDEKMVSLGKLSAGLAHELNNPASAIERSASLLGRRLEESEQAARALGAAHLADEQLIAVDALRIVCTAKVPHGVLSPIQQAEREDDIANWLADHGIDDGVGEALSETAITIDALNQLASAITGAALVAVLQWAATGCAVRALAGEIEDAAERISSLVSAIKGFTHMDQAAVAEPIDLALGLGNTIAVLKSKARNKMISVEIHIEPELPRVLGFGGELNQVWANLIDNALDAAPNSGLVAIIANRDRNRVIVRVSDNGGGIPENILNNIFDPFFTTKPVGQGTGLGLDIVRQLVRHNNGDIVVEVTRPGQTTFRVSLPIAEPKEPMQ